MDKIKLRKRRAAKSRAKINKTRIVVKRSSKNICVQIVAVGGKILASASSLEKDIRAKASYTGNIATAKLVGQVLGQRALANGIKQLAFDRSGYKYHGRVRALADAVREAGVEF